MSLSIVIPTIGRLSLAFTLASFERDLLPEDEVVIVSDGPSYEVGDMVDHFASNAPASWIHSEIEAAGCWGQPARNHGFDIARGSHWATIDDDDIYLPGALDAMRAAIKREPDIPTVFRCKWGPGHFAHGTILWNEQRIRLGTVATPMVVAPASECRFGLDYAGDHAYATALMEKFGRFQWDEQIIAEVRPAIASDEST